MRNAAIAALFGVLGSVLGMSMLGSIQAHAAGNRTARQNYQPAGGGLDEAAADVLYLKLDASNGPLTGDLTMLTFNDLLCSVANSCSIGTAAMRWNSIFISDMFSDRIQARSAGDPVKITELDGLEVTGSTQFFADVTLDTTLAVTGILSSNGGFTLTDSPLLVAGADPVLTACGTAPTVVGADPAGQITIGTGVTSSCTATFAVAYTNAPSCIVTGDNTAVGYAVATTTTTMIITSSANMGTDVVNYFCVGL